MFSFGKAQQQQQNPSPFGNILGTNNATNVGASTQGSLFGGASTTNQLGVGGEGSGFGNNQSSNNQTSLFANNNQQQPSQAQITMTSKYSDLSEQAKKELDEIENFIKFQISASSVIASETIEDGLNEVVSETAEIQRKLIGLKSLLKRDWYAIEQVKVLVTKELRHSDLIARYIDSGPTGNFDASKSSLNHDPYSIYFLNFAVELESRMNQCRQHIEELEMNIRNSSSNRLAPTVIQEILKIQYNSFMSVASKVSAVHDSTVHAKDVLRRHQEKSGMKDETSRANSSTNGGFAQMAAYLVPSIQLNNTMQLSTNMFGKPLVNPILGNNAVATSSSLFGNLVTSIPSSTGTPFKPGTTGLFGPTTSTKRSSSLGK